MGRSPNVWESPPKRWRNTASISCGNWSSDHWPISCATRANTASLCRHRLAVTAHCCRDRCDLGFDATQPRVTASEILGAGAGFEVQGGIGQAGGTEHARLADKAVRLQESVGVVGDFQ